MNMSQGDAQGALKNSLFQFVRMVVTQRSPKPRPTSWLWNGLLAGLQSAKACKG